MDRAPLGIDAELEASLRRMADALARSRDQYTGRVEEALAAIDVARDQRAAPVAPPTRAADRHRRREERRQRQDEARQRRREREEPDEADLPKGIVFAVVAIVCLLFAFNQPAFFWMVFVALGFGLSAATLIGRAASRRRLEREANANATLAPDAEPAERSAVGRVSPPVASPTPGPPAPADPKVARIQLLCDKLLAELESGPPIVREVVTDPRTTIAGLRQACVETARRENELRAVLAAQDESRLIAEREALTRRLSSEQDAIVRDRLGQALAALDQQLVHRAALATAASRLEAENTRILYTVENVHMQLLRARSTDMGAPELGGRLRDSLRQLGTQIEAVAEALEWADVPAGAEVSAGPSSAPAQAASGGSGVARPPEVPAVDTTATQRADAERAERDAAARRAASAREAQRH